MIHYNRWKRLGDANAKVRKKNKPGEGHITANGYKQIRQSLEHRLVMEQDLGRPLTKDENVHHLNGNRLDNNIDNLELWNMSQPAGQRIEDKIAYAEQILSLYKTYDLECEDHMHSW